MATGELEVNGANLPLRFIGFEEQVDSSASQRGEPLAMDAVGLLLDGEIEGWFGQMVGDTDGLTWLIHQRANEQDGFEFLNQMVEKRFDLTFDADRLETVFEPLACVTRHTSWPNYRFLEHLTNFVGLRTASIWGWSVFNESVAPLRLLHLEPALPLDNEWKVPPNQMIPHQLTGAGRFKVLSGFPCDDPLEFFRKVSSLGSQSYTSELKSVVPERTDQLVLLPGILTFEGSRFLCTEIRYIYDSDYLTAELYLEEPVWEAPQLVHPSLVLEGVFEAWEKESDGVGIMKIVPTEGWALCDEHAMVDRQKPILSRMTMPGRASGDLKGYYVRHEADDPMALQVSEGQTPISLGGMQYYRSALEKTDLTVGAQTIDIQAVDALKADGDKIDITAADALKAEGDKVDIPFGQKLTAGSGGSVLNATSSKVTILNKVDVM
jgi:hypothetical protein